MNLYIHFLKNLKKDPKRIFIIEDKKKFSYLDIYNLILKFEKNSFKGSYITIINENSVYYFVLYLLCSKLNKTLVTLDHHLNLEHLKSHIINFNLNNILCSVELKKKLLKNNIKREFISDYPNNNHELRKTKIRKKNEIFLLTFSSGSTSLPKPIAISEKTKVDRARSNIDLFNIVKKDRIIISTPLHHTLAIRLMTIGIILGCEIAFLKKYNLHNFLKMIKKTRSTFTYFVSNQLSEIAKKKKNIKLIKSLKCIVSSSAKLPLKNKIELMKLFPKKIYEIYGLSEAAVVSNLDIKQYKDFTDSVGLAIKGVKIKIDNFKREKFGEIMIKSKFMCIGYLKNNKIERIKTNTYFRTGDIGYINKRFLFFTGRLKKMIKVNGVSIYLEDIENVLQNKKIVDENVVLPIYDKNNINPRICLLYRKKNTSVSFIRNFCFKNLQSYQIPTYIFKVDSIPKNNMGKINMGEINTYVKMMIKT